MMPLWDRVRSGIVEVVYPKTCAGCGMRGTWLCVICAESVPKLDSAICFRCGVPEQAKCRSCSQLDRSIHRARAAYPYTGWVTSAIRSFKYADEWSRASDLAGRMAPTVASLGPIDALVPVPLHAIKLRNRGYNQSHLLAEAICGQLGLDIMPLLVRTRETQSQVDLNQEDRAANVDGAFSLDPGWSPAPGGRYVLIDDVRTTSATLNACAKMLLRTSPAKIFVVTLAFDIPSRQLQPWLDERM